MTKQKYLNNRELLKEIHKSKISYCEFVDPKYNNFDIIVEDLSDILKDETQEEARKNRAARLSTENYKEALDSYKGPANNKPKLAEFRIDPDDIDAEDVVYRVMTYEHIPPEPDRKKTPKRESDEYTRLNFVPFKHYIIKKGKPVEVGRSHSKDGEFCQTHGNITDRLAHMFILLVNKYSHRANWRGYTYLDEMKGQSLLQLSQMGLQFNEAKSDNPFSYFTQAIQNSFTRVLNIEKKNQNVRDEILISRGQTPSFGKQIAHEEEQRRLKEERGET